MLIPTIPQDRVLMMTLLPGMRHLVATHKVGVRYPIPFQIPTECDLPPDYITDDQDTTAD